MPKFIIQIGPLEKKSNSIPFYLDVFLYEYLPLTSKDISVYETDSK